ncbi:hypothetical protein Tco_0869091 [Tanacetum coccineum]
MAERTMEELLRAPTEGYGEAIVILEINADHFEIKTNLLQLVQASPFHGFERENPHTHINNFKRITSTLKFRDASNDVIELIMFPYSLEGGTLEFGSRIRTSNSYLDLGDFSPKIMFDPNPERFTNEPALVCLPPPGDDESFLKKDVQEVNFRIYSNPLFEFDDNYNSSDINPLFNEILEDVESEESNVSNEPVLLNTPLFDEDECFDPGGDINKIDAFLDDYNDSEGDVLEILHKPTNNLSPKCF